MHARARRLPAMDRIERWFATRGWHLAAFQKETIAAYLAGESGLVHAPTGSGKTLAAWLGPLSAEMQGDVPGAGLRVLWITPLRALANDTHRNLTIATAALAVPWEIGLRTGDTSSTLRKKQRERPPHGLVTTPESLSVLLSFADSHDSLRTVQAVVVDEWHELMGSKRGVQLELCLSHLRALNPRLQTWGLSATLGNLDQALTVLMGREGVGRMIHGPPPREVSIESILPPTIERFPWAGHMGTRLLQPVLEAIDAAQTTLVFTNTRSQAEIWYRAIAEARLDWIDRMAIHHGSISMALRRRIEAAVQARQLKCVVCTSSLDLGVDFAPVDQVLQVGSPKGVARLLQRAGRSGHQPDGRSRVSSLGAIAAHYLLGHGERLWRRIAHQYADRDRCEPDPPADGASGPGRRLARQPEFLGGGAAPVPRYRPHRGPGISRISGRTQTRTTAAGIERTDLRCAA